MSNTINLIPAQFPNKEIRNGKKCLAYIDNDNELAIYMFLVEKGNPNKFRFEYEHVYWSEETEDWESEPIGRAKALELCGRSYTQVFNPLTERMIDL